MSRTTLRIAIGLAAVGLAIAAASLVRLYYAQVAAEERAAAERAATPEIGGPFSLIDHHGRAVSDRDFRGKLMLVFFGYTYCPDVCPTELQIISQAMDELGAAGDDVQPLFVTVDPERDTVEVLADYLSNFHPRILGLTGPPDRIAAAAAAYRVAYFKVFYPPFDDDEKAAGDANDETANTDATSSENGNDNADYLMNHSTVTYLMGRDGRFLALFSYGTDPSEMAAGIRKHLAPPVS